MSYSRARDALNDNSSRHIRAETDPYRWNDSVREASVSLTT